ncbi:MAG: adenylyltransferase/cytidyltransferase family protein [Verrucomicrobiota bacterium]
MISTDQMRAILSPLDGPAGASVCVVGEGGQDHFYQVDGILDERDVRMERWPPMEHTGSYPRGAAGIARRLAEFGLAAVWVEPGQDGLDWLPDRHWLCRSGVPMMQRAGSALPVGAGLSGTEATLASGADYCVLLEPLPKSVRDSWERRFRGSCMVMELENEEAAPLVAEARAAALVLARLNRLEPALAEALVELVGAVAASTRAGTGICSAEIRRAMVVQGLPTWEAKVLVRGEELRSWRAGIRRAGRRLAMANGCFDLLHPGHLHLLRQAAGFGDYLLVAVNSDISVHGLKGPGRPIQDERLRAEVISALDFVSGVTLFDEVSVLELVEEILPDVLVKGGDYRKEEVVGWREVEAAGGRVVTVPLRAGFSTSNQVARMKGEG